MDGRCDAHGAAPAGIHAVSAADVTAESGNRATTGLEWLFRRDGDHEALAPFGTTPFEDLPPAGGAHPRPESVAPLAHQIRWLKGAFHCSNSPLFKAALI